MDNKTDLEKAPTEEKPQEVSESKTVELEPSEKEKYEAALAEAENDKKNTTALFWILLVIILAIAATPYIIGFWMYLSHV
ncbi:hypothetical protein J6T21_01900 [Candidatus Saccharibacteria bacterium]|nr:hypothetical protein [Candidatus Saccharibacteria bacterium]